jgi:diguanylate cyclase (GGDEF)-like protein/PAS domain S-box-containing protein
MSKLFFNKRLENEKLFLKRKGLKKSGLKMVAGSLPVKNTLFPDGLPEGIELEEILEIPMVRHVLDCLQEFTPISFAIVDLQGKMLATTGWQKICSEFHRVHPLTKGNCIEEEDCLSRDLKPGEYLVYRCKNNLCGIVTPVMLFGKHAGDFFMGQFFFEDEIPEVYYFEHQADLCGFDREAYLDAVMRVPRWSREKARKTMKFCIQMLSLITHVGEAHCQRVKEIEALNRSGEALEKSRETYRNLLDVVHDWAWEINREGVYSHCSSRVKTVLGYEPEEMIGQSLWNLMPESERADSRTLLQKSLDGAEPVKGFKSTRIRKDGSPVVLETNAVPFFDQEHQLVGYVGVDHDITAFPRGEAELRRRELALNSILKAFSIGIGLSQNRTIRWSNDSFLRLTGYSADELFGKSSRILYETEEEFERVGKVQLQGVSQEGFGAVEFRMKRKDGTVMDTFLSLTPLDPGNPAAGFSFAAMDITERKNHEQALEYRATHDSLTELPNRVLLAERINQSIFYAERSKRFVALLLLDLDRFKRINDILGHKTGDLLFKEVAQRLSDSIRSGDTVARFGGDEFAVVLAEVAKLSDVDMVVRKIQKNLSQPIVINRQKLEISTSAGISIFPRDGRSADSLIQRADLAMYYAKRSGGNTFRHFSPEMTSEAQEKLKVEAGIREALRNNEFVLHYQPKVEIKSGRVSGCEALIRWQHPQKGMLLPGSFIPVAEETGLIVPLGTWVLREACRQVMEWQNAGLSLCQISLNVSACQFHEAGFVGQVGEILDQSGVSPRMIALELTESAILEDIPSAVKIITQLQDMGLSLQLDDFGTGFSNFNSLRQFDVDYLKIDCSYIADVLFEPKVAAIVRSIIAIARNLGITSVAEGVENRDQLNFLVECGCDEFQGYLISRPVPADEVVKFFGGRTFPLSESAGGGNGSDAVSTAPQTS